MIDLLEVEQFFLAQVCLMSQSWNNVANMHELLIVLKFTYSEKIVSSP